MLVAVTYFLLPKLADLPGVAREIGNANWGWVPLVVLFSALTYVGAALGMGGAVPARLRGPDVARAGRGVVREQPRARGRRRHGPQRAVLAEVRCGRAGGGVERRSQLGGRLAVHIVLMFVFFAWAGKSGLGSISLPSWSIVAIGVAALALLVTAAFAIPVTRKLLVTRLVPVLGRAVSGLAAVMRSPGKIALLFGGSAVLTLSYVLAVYFSTVAFGGGLDLAQVGAAYLVGSAIATVAPTPGGLGALEAAVIAGLVSAGMSSTEAVPAVFLFRLATYWLPILPGWFAFNHLRQENFV